MKILRILLLIVAVHPLASWGQISGVVKGLDNGKEIPLPGANVIWEGSETGTTTAKDGSYTIDKVKGTSTLKVSYIGYQSQSKIVISRTGTMDFTLEPSGYELEGAEVVGKVDATTVDVTKAGLSYKIDDKELRKAACCNLSESFETNASVDVSFTDAVTGTRQIEMLGLSGKYALIQRENIPFARGLNSNTGLTYIPGPFVESIQLTKGLSSVLNGYEGITGQINVEFYKPETAPKLYLNAFGNQGSRTELNVMSAIPVNKHLSTAILAHASAISIPRDGNDDGFADIPNGSQLNFTNRWHFKNPDRGWEGQIGVSAVQSKKVGGQMDYITEDNPGNSLWGFESEGRRAELFGKNGYVFKDKPFRSIGIIYSLTYQDHNGRFGERFHYGEQQNAYLNTIYQDIIGSTIHKYRTGISFQLDQITDRLSKPQLEDPLYLQKRTEAVPGAYFEYTLEPNPRFTLVAGIRGDYNNYFEELYITPRLNVRYSLSDHTTFRLGGGRGQRTANVMLENLNLLASSRTMDFTALGISPEVAWNTGASLVQDMHIIDRKLTLTVDAFYTWFDNKVVADLDVDPNTAYFISSTGSRSLSVLSQIDYELSSNFEVRLAYKYLNAKDQFAEELRQSYLIPEHRAFVNLAYQTEQQWKFDLTLNWFGSKRLPDTETSPDEFKRDPQSPGFFTVNAQINKTFKNGLEIFAGVDNLLDFRQDDPIVNADNPYSPYFDTNFTWGPVFGRNVYVGLYYTLPDKENFLKPDNFHLMAHQHEHPSGKNLRLAFFLNVGFTILEIIGGLFTNSVAILSDALHDLGDSLSLGVSWFLERKSHKKANLRFTFGYKRFTLLGALINSLVLISGSVFIISEAIQRLQNPEPADAQGMVWFAILGVIVNGYAAWKVSSGKTLNERVVSWHLIEDVLGWVAVLIVSIVLLFTDLYFLDPALSLLITLYVLYNVVKRLKETLSIFLQARPDNVDLDEVIRKIKEDPKVKSLHHTHLWSLDGEHHVFTTHICLQNVRSFNEVVACKQRLKEMLKKDYHFSHYTIETELDEESCSLRS